MLVNESKKSPFEFPHAAALVSTKGNIVAISHNKPIGAFESGAGRYSLHAEIAAINKIPRNKIRGLVLVVIRRMPNGTVGYSKPCPECAKKLTMYMNKYGLKRVVYSA